MRRVAVTPSILLAVLLLALTVPVSAQDTTAIDSLRTEAVRSRAFIRAAETQLSKVLDMLARMTGEPIGEPVPPDTTTPVPPVEPTPAGVLFEADFASGELLDGWDQASRLSENNKHVVPATGLDFPTTNVLRITHTSSSSARLYKYGLPVPAVGESRFYRWYIRVTMPDGLSDNSTHPIESGRPGPWAFEIENSPSRGVPAGHFGIWWLSEGEGTAVGFRWYLGADNQNLIALRKGVTYRVEYQWTRTGETTYRQHARIYDSTGALLYDDADFNNYDGSVNMASNPDLRISAVDGMSAFHVGSNGIMGGGPFPFVYGYQGAFCIRSDTWCGPY